MNRKMNRYSNPCHPIQQRPQGVGVAISSQSPVQKKIGPASSGQSVQIQKKCGDLIVRDLLFGYFLNPFFK